MEKQLQTPFGDIHIRESGDGPPLLCVHGLFASTTTFDALFAQEQKTRRLVALDLPNNGLSTPAADFQPGWDTYLEAVIEVADQLGLESFDMIGHSMGAGICAMAAARYPDRVSKLILSDAVSLPYQVPLRARLPLVPLLGPLVFRHIYGEKMFLDYFRGDVFHDEGRMDVEKIRLLYRQFDGRRTLALRAIRATASPTMVETAIPRISAPTLLIWGEQDSLVPLSVGRELEKQMKNAMLLIISRCGHAPLEEKGGESADAIFRFLSD